MKQSFNPCDECPYSYSKNNQETGMCDICEFQKLLGGKGRCEIMIFPMRIGDTVFVDSKTIPVDKMDFEEVKAVPLYFPSRVISFRKNSKGRFVKLAVRAEWEYEYIDPETGPDCWHHNVEKYFTYPLSAFGKTIFLTETEADNALRNH